MAPRPTITDKYYVRQRISITVLQNGRKPVGQLGKLQPIVNRPSDSLCARPAAITNRRQDSIPPHIEARAFL
jgi:hypothetical protein